MELKVGIPDEVHNARFSKFTFEHLVADSLTLRCGNYFEGLLDLLLKVNEGNIL